MKQLNRFPNVIDCLIMIQNDAFLEKLLILDKRCIGRDEHAYTILILNHVLAGFRPNSEIIGKVRKMEKFYGHFVQLGK